MPNSLLTVVEDNDSVSPDLNVIEMAFDAIKPFAAAHCCQGLPDCQLTTWKSSRFKRAVATKSSTICTVRRTTMTTDGIHDALVLEEGHIAVVDISVDQQEGHQDLATYRSVTSPSERTASYSTEATTRTRAGVSA